MYSTRVHFDKHSDVEVGRYAEQRDYVPAVPVGVRLDALEKYPQGLRNSDDFTLKCFGIKKELLQTGVFLYIFLIGNRYILIKYLL